MGSNNGTGQCISCSSKYTNCVTCNYLSCLTCVDGFFLSGGACESCANVPNCMFCSNSSKCELCLSNFALDTDGKCTICNGKYITNPNGVKKCMECSDFLPNCAYCENNVCVTCETGFYLSESKTCIQCQDLAEYDVTQDILYEKCNYCSNFFENCFSCDKSICFQCLTNNFHKDFTSCSPCMDDGGDAVCFSCSSIETSIENCALCEFFNTKFQCIKCKDNFYLTPQGECISCNQSESQVIFNGKYCLTYSLPIHETNALVNPNDFRNIDNMVASIFFPVCSLYEIDNSYNNEVIVYWSAIPISNENFDHSFENVKEKSLALNDTINFESYESFNYSVNNQIFVFLAADVEYQIFYFCEKPLSDVNKNKNGEFHAKRLKNLSLSSEKIIIHLSIRNQNAGMIESNERLMCLLENLLNLGTKSRISYVNGLFFSFSVYLINYYL